MPRVVDHAQRRSQILEALLRLAGRAGLPAVTMRAVATEAGVSLRLVQYYFATKGALLHSALETLEQRSHRRWAERMAALPAEHSTRDVVEQFLAEALPTDDESRVFHLVWTSYAVLAMTDADLAARPFVAGPHRLERQLTDLLRTAGARGEMPGTLDPAEEATHLVSLAHGLGTSVLVGLHDVGAADRVLRSHLDRVLPRDAARTRR
ncbi:TetR/AcrR family transcriptional regulator [Saccharomonospora halophila]|uniref:TetR/AcrR family transcriptional regulator n=1 Tax=Saccharomonospora halophila TaxID=129922 RepID=UPI00036A24AA|nr:TetR family transcriptional regulator C-terminal domain-containing protein [Saccharomonospora halophila]